MVFSSISFLYYFLPVVIIAYYLLPYKLKNVWLLVCSVIFYYYGEQRLVLVMLLSALVDYTASLFIEKFRTHRYIPKVSLGFSLVVNLGLLFYFKYSDFFISNLSAVTGIKLSLLQISMPIGISFYTFQTMSYTIDVYYNRVRATKNPGDFAAYVTLFPQLIAGPIVRYSTVAEELKQRTHSFDDFAYGTRRFILGLSKKVLLANTFAEFSKIFTYSDEKTILFYWLYAFAFFFQIYFDFSGYSDMAIGLGRIFGFHFLENFNYPYIAKSVTDFWRRWHISLSSWFRDYLYIPLGGNRVSKGKWIRNILIVWFVTGFWHGAAWNFILWGGYYAFLLLFEKLFFEKILNKVPRVVSTGYTIIIVLLGFVIFNANNLDEAQNNLYYMFGGGDLPFTNAVTTYYLSSYLIVFVISAIAATPLMRQVVLRIEKTTFYNKLLQVIEPILLLLLLMIVTGFLVDGSYNPFLYFRF